MNRADEFLIILLFIGISVVLLPAVSYSQSAGNSSAGDVREDVSRENPVVVDMTGAKVFFRSFLGQKPLVVVFWATWCTLCRDEVPALNRLAADPKIRLLAVNVGENEQKVQAFISSFHIGYPVYRDPGWQATSTYKIAGIPACILLDKGGQIIYRGSSVPENVEAYLQR